jgi:hypothetical protein
MSMVQIGEVTRKRINSFVEMEAMSPAMRECVHEYGFAIVKACHVAGIKSPAALHQLVREIWEGARQPRQKRQTGGTLDWLLLNAGAEISAAELERVLLNNNLAIVPINPTRAMLDASLQEVSGYNVRCTKEEKHRRRISAAIRAAVGHLQGKR